MNEKANRAKAVHYFPGHMKKAMREMEPYVKLVDLIIEIVDARAPKSTRNPWINELIKGKKHLIVLSKSDLSDETITKEWVKSFEKEGIACFNADLKKEKIINKLNQVSKEIFKAKREKEEKLGMKKQPVRLMVVGVPNVGKSTFINSLKGKARAKVANKAGLTRSEQWLKVSDDFILLDTPGILPMNYEDHEVAIKLALLGTMREDILPYEELAESLFNNIRIRYKGNLKDRFAIEDLSSISFLACMDSIAQKRGLLENGRLSQERSCYLFLKEFKDGLLGKMSLESVDA